MNLDEVTLEVAEIDIKVEAEAVMEEDPGEEVVAAMVEEIVLEEEVEAAMVEEVVLEEEVEAAMEEEVVLEEEVVVAMKKEVDPTEEVEDHLSPSPLPPNPVNVMINKATRINTRAPVNSPGPAPS